MFTRITPVALAATLLLAGCANPILRVEAPGYSLEASKAPAAEPRSMDEALQKLNHFRAAYYEAIRSQVGQAQDATTGLVWLGTVIAGLAVAEVHRDAILGTSLIGGTTYGLVRTQIDARRLEVWTNGLEALDCAREASLPMDMDPHRQAELRSAVADLSTQRGLMQSAVSKVRDAMVPLAKLPVTVAAATDVVSKAEVALADADRTLAAAVGLLEAARGRELSATVDRIHTGVTKAMKDIAVDPKSIKPLVAGLGGFAEVFAPNSGIQSGLAAAFKTFSEKASAHGAAEVDLTNAIKDLESRVPLLAKERERTRALLKEVDLAQVTAALKKCGVAGVSIEMTLEPSTLAFTGAGSQGFEIKGGTPPYEVKPLGTLPEGIAPVFSGGLADTADVKVAAGVKGNFRLRVTDSSPTMRSQQLSIIVSEASGGTGTGTTTQSDATTKADWTALRTAIEKPGFNFKIGPSVFKVSLATLTDRGLQVKLTCAPAPNPKPKALEVREKLAAADTNASQRLKQANALDVDATQIDVSANLGCVTN